MKKVIFLFILFPFLSTAQNSMVTSSIQDELIIIKSDPYNGFDNSYILFIPKGVQKNKLTRLLVEPNNTGKVTDTISVHKKYAISLASQSSVGNNISRELRIPLLVPIFPRPSSKPLVYTHALDRDVIFEKSKKLKRLDLQLIAMIKDAQKRLKKRNILVHHKIFMNGFSASATFTNRFLFIHPELVAAAAMGGFNGELMLPVKKYKNREFDYPLGVNDFEKIFNKKFNYKNYQSIPQHIYMGALDKNDAVQFDDAYNKIERDIINTMLGKNVQNRYKKCQQVYIKKGISARFRTYKQVGHWTTSNINLNVILFFLKELKKSN